MLLFSVHPEPNGRKVDKMLTLKKVKELVEAPSHAKRTPSPKMLFEEGIVLLRREFDQGQSSNGLQQRLCFVFCREAKHRVPYP